ncbi:MAG: ABC transporter permease [Rhodospirillales bacterium]
MTDKGLPSIAAPTKAGSPSFALSQETRRGLTLLSPTMILLVLALAFPLLVLIGLSFWTQAGMKLMPDFTFANYEIFFEKRIYYMVLLKSIENSAIVACVTVLLAYPAAYFIAFKVKKRKIMWLILITLPFWTSYLLRVFAWKVILGYNGVINSGLMSIGVIDEPLTFLLNNREAVVITLAHAWAAFAILPIYVSLEKIDRSLLEAAADLGENPLWRFLRVTLPLSVPGIMAAFLLVFIPTVGDYVTPQLVGGNSGIMIGNLVQTQFGRGNNWPLGAAVSIMSMITITAVVCLALLLIYQIRRRLA